MQRNPRSKDYESTVIQEDDRYRYYDRALAEADGRDEVVPGPGSHTLNVLIGQDRKSFALPTRRQERLNAYLMAYEWVSYHRLSNAPDGQPNPILKAVSLFARESGMDESGRPYETLLAMVNALKDLCDSQGYSLEELISDSPVDPAPRMG